MPLSWIFWFWLCHELCIQWCMCLDSCCQLKGLRNGIIKCHSGAWEGRQEGCPDSPGRCRFRTGRPTKTSQQKEGWSAGEGKGIVQAGVNGFEWLNLVNLCWSNIIPWFYFQKKIICVKIEASRYPCIHGRWKVAELYHIPNLDLMTCI